MENDQANQYKIKKLLQQLQFKDVLQLCMYNSKSNQVVSEFGTFDEFKEFINDDQYLSSEEN